MTNKYIVFGAVLSLLFSCKARVPEDVIEKDTMESLLYDYHLAQALSKNKGDSVNYYKHIYIESVYRKYGVTEAEFNHSMEWYTRNSEELFKIYQNIDKRFAQANSENVVVGNPYASMTAAGDTMNIWAGRNFYLLSNKGNNSLQFEQKADSSFSKGDRLMWQFDTNWYYREGQKNAMLSLSLIYENDSVVSTTQSIYSSGSQDIYITVGDLPVQSVQGFVYQMTDWSEQPRLLTISDPVLVRFKKKKPKVVNLLGDKKMDETGSEKLKIQQPLSEDSLKAIQESLHDDRVVKPEPKVKKEVTNEKILHLPR